MLQLIELGISFNLIPNSYPFTLKPLQISIENYNNLPVESKTTNGKLNKSLNEPKEYDNLVKVLIELYLKNNTSNINQCLKFILLFGYLEFERGNYSDCYQTLEKLNDQKLTKNGNYDQKLIVLTLLLQLISHKLLSLKNDKNWLKKLLKLFECWSTLSSSLNEDIIELKEIIKNIKHFNDFSEFIYDLNNYNNEHDNDLIYSTFTPLFSLKFKNNKPLVEVDEHLDGTFLKCTIESKLPCRITSDQITLSFKSKFNNNDIIDYEIRNVNLNHGHNDLNLYCKSTYLHNEDDYFKLSNIRIKLKNIILFDKIFDNDKRSRLKLKLPIDLNCLNVELIEPVEETDDNDRSSLVFSLCSLRHNLKYAIVNLKNDELKFNFNDVEHMQGRLMSNENNFEIRHLKKNENFKILIPFQNLNIRDRIDVKLVNVEIKYEIDDDSNDNGKGEKVFKTNIGHKVSSNVKIDINYNQTNEKLISTFNLKPDLDSNIRINEVKLIDGINNDDKELITSCDDSNIDQNFILSFNETSTFSFIINDITRKNNYVLLVRYSNVDEELKHYINELTSHLLTNNDERFKIYSKFITNLILNESYSKSSKRFNKISISSIERQINKLYIKDGVEKQTLTENVNNIIENLLNNNQKKDINLIPNWKIKKLRVTLPSYDIINEIDVNILNNKDNNVYLGQNVETNYKILVKSLKDNENHDYKITFEIDSCLDEWLINGKVKGQLQLNEEFNLNINLLPLKLGLINLPSINIFKINNDNEKILLFNKSFKSILNVISNIKPEQTFIIDLPNIELLNWVKEKERINDKFIM